MKKLLIGVVTCGLVLFSACDLFVNPVEVQKGLVTAMDKVMTSEESFYNEYWDLVDGSDTTPFLDAVDSFEGAVSELENYFDKTRFHSSQQAIVDQYNNTYKSFIDSYIEDVDTFAEKIKKDGFVYKEFEPLFPEIDQHTIDFVSVHKELSDIVNSESESEAAEVEEDVETTTKD